MNSLARAIYGNDELKAQQILRELINDNVMQFAEALQSHYSFLIGWASGMPGLLKMLESHVGDEKRKTESCIFNDTQQIEINATGSCEVGVSKEEFTWKFVNPDWLDWNEHEISFALTKRDAHLVKSLNWNEIMAWLKCEDDSRVAPPCQLESAFQETIDWIISLIDEAEDKNKRGVIVDKFINIGCILLKHKNFHGATQIARALDSVAVCFEDVAAKLKNCSELINCERNKTHENYINNFKVQENMEKEALIPLLPVSAVFWTKMKYENLPQENDSGTKFFSILQNFEKVACQCDKDSSFWYS